jgi:predicted transcriptional regulator
VEQTQMTMIFTQMQNRSHTEITAQILDAAIKPISKTRLMYSAYISTRQAQDYFTELIEKKLLFYNPLRKTYLTTDLGKKYLKIHDSLVKLGKVVDKQQ